MKNPFRKQQSIKKWNIKIIPLGTHIFPISNSQHQVDLNHELFIDIEAPIIDCNNGGTCETSTDGGFRIVVTPIDV